MKFEDRLDLEGSDDVYRHLVERTTVNVRDGHEWSWTTRFCAAHPEHPDWVGTALGRLVDERLVDEEMRSEEGDLGEVFRTANHCRLGEHLLPRVSAHLSRDLSAWSDDDVQTLLSYLLECEPKELDSETLETVARLGRRKDCFGTALLALHGASVERSVTFMVEEAANALAQGYRRVMRPLASKYMSPRFAEHRARVVAALAASPQALEEFREQLAKTARLIGTADALLAELDELLAGDSGG